MATVLHFTSCVTYIWSYLLLFQTEIFFEWISFSCSCLLRSVDRVRLECCGCYCWWHRYNTGLDSTLVHVQVKQNVEWQDKTHTKRLILKPNRASLTNVWIIQLSLIGTERSHGTDSVFTQLCHRPRLEKYVFTCSYTQMTVMHVSSQHWPCIPVTAVIGRRPKCSVASVRFSFYFKCLQQNKKQTTTVTLTGL